MSKCGRCGDEGHNIRTCPMDSSEKRPWLKDPDERWHTKIVYEEDWPGSGVTEREVSCNCDLFDAGETHIDFSDVD